ncbi:MAG: cyclic nucleotide-binding/CBS domain-containing protein [Phycisphaerae bacterium]
MRCPQCSHDNIPGEDVCVQCGHDLEDLDLPVACTDLERTVMEDPLGNVEPDPPLMVAPDTSLGEVVELLARRRVGAAMVGHEGAVLGIFTERDVLMKVGDRFAELRGEPVHRFMTPNPVTLGADASIAYALNRMDVGRCRHVPVLKDGEPVGTVSFRRVLRYLAQKFPDLLSA